jgi:hypothetical protein
VGSKLAAEMFDPKEETMSRSTKISTLILAFATAAVFAGNAMAIGARADNGATGGSTALEIPYLSHGAGITREVPTVSQSTIPYLSHGVGITREAETAVSVNQSTIPYLSHGVGITREAETALSVSRQGPMDRAHANSTASTGTPIFRDTPDGLLPRDTVTVSVASSSSVDWSEVALGFSFGLGLAMLGALGVLVLQRTRTVRTQ